MGLVVWGKSLPPREWISRGIELYAHSAVFTPNANAFRLYYDGTESGSSPIAAQDTNATVPAGMIVHLRYRIQETGGASGATTDDYQLQVSKNGGAYANVTGSSANVKAAGTYTREEPDRGSSLSDGSASTNRATNGITDGTGSFVAGKQEEGDGNLQDHQLTASNFTEHVWALFLVADDLVDGDTLAFRISLNGGAPGMTNSVTPTLTVDKKWTKLTSGNESPPDTTSDTASITPPADTAIYAVINNRIGSGSPGTPTLSGNGLTWTQVRTVTDGGNHRLTLFRAAGIGSPSSGAVTITFGAQQERVGWNIFYSNPYDDIIQDADYNGASAASHAASLGAFADSAHDTIMTWMYDNGNRTIVPEQDYGLIARADANGIQCAETYYRNANDTSPSISLVTTNGVATAIVWEVGTAVIPVPSQPNMVHQMASQAANWG